MFKKIVFIFFLSLIVVSFMWIYNSNQQKKIQDITPSQIMPIVDNMITLNEDINWEYYQHPEYDYLRFRYPEASEITLSLDPDTSICEMKGCYELTMRYEGMTMRYVHSVGAGGSREIAPSYPYTIIYGDPYEGIAREYNKTEEPGLLTISYFKLLPGAQVLGNFLSDKGSLTFSFLEEELSLYQGLADKIATSFFDVVPVDEPGQGLVYLKQVDMDNRIVVMTGEGGVEKEVGLYEPMDLESIVNVILSPGINYLAVLSQIANGPESYLYFYGIDDERYLTIGGNMRLSSYPEANGWVNESVYQYSNEEGDFEANMVYGTVTERAQ